MSSDHHEVRQALGAYTIGALDADERAEVEAHLADCAACRDELAGLAVLPGLLGRLSADEAASGLLAVDTGRAERAITAVAVTQRGARLRLRLWQLAATAALLALVAVLVPWPVGDAGWTLRPQPVASDADTIDGWVRVTEQTWGMQVDIELRGLPERRGYSLVAVRGDDHRATAASWTATDEGAIRLTGSCYVNAGDLARFEVVAPDDEVLATFET